MDIRFGKLGSIDSILSLKVVNIYVSGQCKGFPLPHSHTRSRFAAASDATHNGLCWLAGLRKQCVLEYSSFYIISLRQPTQFKPLQIRIMKVNT
jgi:hypothetical protein